MKIFGALCILRHVVLGNIMRKKETFFVVDGVGLKVLYEEKSQLTAENIRKFLIKRNEIILYTQAENKEDAVEAFMRMDGFNVGDEGEKRAIQLVRDTIFEIECDDYLHLGKLGRPVCGKPMPDDDLYGEIGFCVLSVSIGQDECPDSCPVFNDKHLIDWLNEISKNRCETRVTSFDRCTLPPP